MFTFKISLCLTLLTSLTAALRVRGDSHLDAKNLRPRDVIVTCSFSVVAASGDTCSSIATSWGLSVEGLETLNPTLTTCPTLATGQSYCVLGSVVTTSLSTTKTTTSPPATTTSAPYQPQQSGIVANCNSYYFVQVGDTCDIITSKFSISAADFYKWNPAVGSDCTHMWAENYVCVGVPGAVHVTPTPTPTPNGPQPQMPGIVSNCKKYFLVGSGDSCYTIQQAKGVTLAQLLAWNTQVNKQCTNLWLGYYICVGV